MGHKFEISFIGDHPKHPNAYNLHPCIEVSIAPDKASFSDPAKVQKVWATVDTGADHLAVDRTFAVAMKLPFVKFANVNGVDSTPVFKAFMLLPGTEQPFEVTMVSQDHEGLGAPYRCVLGRILLNAGRLQYDVQNNQSFLMFD